MVDNITPHRSSEYDEKVKKTIPFYENFHLETINLVQTINPGIKKWLDAGCGTGYLIEKAVVVFDDCRFVLVDSSGEMMEVAKKRLKDYKNIEYLEPVKTEDIEVREHLKLLNSIGFRAVEILWMSYLQAGFFCIR